MDRRTFLRLVAGAGAGVSGAGFMHSHVASQPQPAQVEPSRIGQKFPDRWISPVMEPAYIKPGLWTVFATTCRECPAGCGMHVRVREGRAIKCEGSPDHPVSRGGLCPRGQSAPQGLYDPDRVRGPLRRSSNVEGLRDSFRPTSETDRPSSRGGAAPDVLRPTSDVTSVATATGGRSLSHRVEGPGLGMPNLVPLPPVPSGFESRPWAGALAEVAAALKGARRLFVLSDLQTGALAEVMQQFTEAFGGRRPEAGGASRLLFYEAFDYEPWRAAHEKLLGRAVLPRYRLAECDLILSLGADFLETWLSNVEFTWQFTQMHHRGPDYRGELIYLGPKLSMTAANADYFLPIPAGQESQAALAILQEVARLKGNNGMTGGRGAPSPNTPALRAVARRLAEAKNPVVLGGPVGARGPAAENLAAVVVQLNQALGAVGRAVDPSQVHALGRTTPLAQVEQMLAALTPEDALIVHQTNPAYSLPHLRPHLERVGTLVYIGTMLNETARMARWVLPVHSPLEAWGDYEPWTGLHCLMQPTMGALHDTRHSGDVFLTLAEQYGRPLSKAGERLGSFRDWLRADWRPLHERIAPKVEFELFWRQALQRGGVFETPEKTGPAGHVRPVAEVETPARSNAVRPISDTSAEAVHLWLWPSIKLYDGRLANRGWLQEVPERMSTIAWGSWIDISPSKAREIEVATGDVLEISNQAGRVQAPARVTEEVADNVVALAFGQGHTALGKIAAGIGVNAFELWAGSDGASLFGAVELRKTGARATLMFLSGTQDQYGRGIVKWTTPEDLRALKKNDVEEIIWPGPSGYSPDRDLYPPHEYPEHRWAMVIDLDRCIGCGACTVACYAENNAPVVGPGPLGLGRTREMTWLRVPPYRDAEDTRRVGFLPLPCQHCDAAPCEPVCPVFAAVHNDQGLNAQIYNRCIGTRFCSNNCPYKVRRFNWFDPVWHAPLQVQLNPDVMARCRGVMEKCTFCIQRIHYHERQAKVEGRPLRDGEIQPACVQSCPAKVFVFGDLMLAGAEVSKFFQHPRRYQLLKELNTKPGVLYLKRIKPSSPGVE